jgi:ankyrin repeat protein
LHFFDNNDSVLERWLYFHNPNPFSWSKDRFHNAQWTGFKQSRKSSADRNARMSCFSSPIFYAAATGLPRVVELLIAQGHNVNHTNDIYPTPLHVAVLRGDLTTTEMILRHGGNVDEQHAKAGRPLQIAAASGDSIALVKLLVESGATLSQAASDFTILNSYTGYLNHMHGTVLHAACYGGSVAVLKYLFEAGEKLDLTTSPTILRALYAGFQQSIYEKLITPASAAVCGVVPEGSRPSFERRLGGFQEQLWHLLKHPAFTRDYTEIVRELLKHGLYLEKGPWDAYHPTDARFVAFLMELGGAPATVTDELGDSLLHRALHDNRPDVFNELLEHGADINTTDCLGRTCLDYASGLSPSLLQEFKLSSENATRTTAEDRRAKIYHTARYIIEQILESDSASEQTYPALRLLGHCLMHLERRDDARIVFQMTIFAASQPSTGLRQRAFCDGCGADCPDTTLYVCQSCRDVDLCEPCFQSYRAGTLRPIHLCCDHEFLAVPLVHFDDDYTHFLPRLTLKIRQWVLGLGTRVPQLAPTSEIEELKSQPDEEADSSTKEIDLRFEPPPLSNKHSATTTQIDIEDCVDPDEFTYVFGAHLGQTPPD